MRQAWLRCAAANLVADASGALVWPDQALVVVADLHFEKGSSLARCGMLLPPYDTRSTIQSLEAVLARWQPRRVISLGDGFHDPEAAERLARSDRDRLTRLTRAHDWIWVRGNHDPEPPRAVGGHAADAVAIAGLAFRHLPAAAGSDAEIAGHLHPTASVTVRGRRLRRRCFVGDRKRLVMPAFGSYTGGLDVFDPAIATLFTDGFHATLVGDRQVHALPHQRLNRPYREEPGRRRPGVSARARMI